MHKRDIGNSFLAEIRDYSLFNRRRVRNRRVPLSLGQLWTSCILHFLSHLGYHIKPVTRCCMQSSHPRWTGVAFCSLFPKMIIWQLQKTRCLFLESPETFRAHFGWHNSLCIFKTKASRGTKLCSYCYFYSLYNIWKDQLYRISRSEFYEWLFGPEKFSGLSRNGPLIDRGEDYFSTKTVNRPFRFITGCNMLSKTLFLQLPRPACVFWIYIMCLPT